MNLISRAEWGARSPRSRVTGNLSSRSTCHWNGPTITIGGSRTWDHARCASLIRGIQNFHMDGRGWSDIAYNFMICPHGFAFEGRGLNIVNGANGTNVANRSSHALMCLGGEENVFSDNEKAEFRDIVAYVAIHTNAPDDCIGHRDHKSTACPGDERYNWVHQGMPTTTAVPDIPVVTPPTSSMEDEDMHVLVWNGNNYSESTTEIHDLHYDPPKSLGKGNIARSRAQFLIDCGVAVVDDNKLPFPDKFGIVEALGGKRS